ncbi:hypothetical protein AB4Y95_06910 [Arthrobacter sp. M-10]|uniref:hypothetical protein n=1 Tax=unclassified Arthrobacter TaxID=235627 RepID=UPI003F9376A3
MIEVFGTHSFFLRHCVQLADAVAVDLQLFATMPEATPPALDVRQLATSLSDLGIAPFGDDVFTVRDHETLKRESFSVQNGCHAVTGIRVALPNRTPQFAHLSARNREHPSSFCLKLVPNLGTVMPQNRAFKAFEEAK